MMEDHPEILKDYIFVKDIGEGNFGKVKLSILRATNEQYAIKILNKEKLKTQTKSSSFNEIEIISKLKHPNIIHVEKILEDNDNFYIIMEYCQKGELFEYIVNKEKLDQIESSIFFYQLINGVEYIHSQGFVHRDLKPENLLLTKNKTLKIIDFGLCHNFNGTDLLKTKCGSPSYAAPEILKGLPYDGFKTDIWCCGIILYGMLCGFLPFDGDNNQEIFKQIVQCNPEYPSFLEDDSINLLIGILNPKPKKRLSINQIKNHPFYLKGKKYYLIQYENNEFEEFKNNEFKNNNNNNNNHNFGNYNSVEKKKYTFSSARKEKGRLYTFNNNNTLRMKKYKNFKNNIYKNIFTNISPYEDEEEENNKFLLNNNKENDQNDKQSKKSKQSKQSKESDKYDKAKKRKINEISGLANNLKNFKQISETEGNEGIDSKSTLLLRTFKNKFKHNKLKLDSNKLFFYNNDNFSKRFHINNYHSNKKNKEINKKNGKSLDINLINPKPSDKNIQEEIFNLKYNKNNKLIDRNIKNTFKEINNIKELQLNSEKLDFFQKFLINKNKNKIEIENIGQSPTKINEINFNLILTKEKEKEKKENKQNEDNNNNEKENILSIRRNKIFDKDKILFTGRKKKSNSAKKRIILHSEINLSNSPNSNNNKYQRKYKLNKYFGSIYAINNKEEGCHTCSIKKRGRRNNINKKLNLKIINLNTREKTTKKEIRNKIKSYPNKKDTESLQDKIMNKNLNLNGVFKTEPKYNHFLDKVIKQINSNNRAIKNNINILTFNNKFKNEENKQILKFLNHEKNNKENLGYPYLIKYYKNNSNKKIQKHLKDDKIYFNTINQKLLENNINSKDKLLKIFPNLSLYNKNI